MWALRVLFEDPVGAHLVFKGGTSLSKAHRLIERFSEDVDLTHDIRELAADLLPRGDGGEVLDIPETRSQIRRVSEAIRNERLPAWVSGTVAPIIQARLERDGAQAMVELDGCNLSIRYAEQDYGQVKSAVLLEFGARATGEPADVHDIACDSAAAGLDIDLPTARPKVMKAERTFWEKATAVHVFCRSGDPVGDHKMLDFVELHAEAFAQRRQLVGIDVVLAGGGPQGEQARLGRLQGCGRKLTGAGGSIKRGARFARLDHCALKTLAGGAHANGEVARGPLACQAGRGERA